MGLRAVTHTWPRPLLSLVSVLRSSTNTVLVTCGLRPRAPQLLWRHDQPGRKRAQTARKQEGMGDRPQTIDDGVAQLGRTTGQSARNQGGMQHELLSLMAAREGIGHVLYHQAPPHANPPLPTRPVSELLTLSSYSEALTDEYSHLWLQAEEK